MTDYDTALQKWLTGADASGEPADARPRRVGFARNAPVDGAALERVRGWTRARFELGDDIAVMVNELACALPGCPPRETVVAFDQAARTAAPLQDLLQAGPPRW